MKKIIAATITMLIFGFVLFMLWHIVKNNNKQDIDIEQLVQIELTNQIGNTSTIFQSRKTVIILYFKTSCQHCIDEINAIAENIQQFNDVKLFLVSSENQDRIIEFSSYFEIGKQYFFHDKTGKLKQELNIKSYPAIFLFSKKKELIRQFKGVVPIDKIISEIPNE